MVIFNWQKQWSYNKYWVMSKSQKSYETVRLMAKNNDWSETKSAEFESIIKSLENIKPTKKTLTNTYQHIWGYFKKICTDSERKEYINLITSLEPENDQLGTFLKGLTYKYQIKYLMQSRIIKEIGE
ncbi:YbgA family protein [Companilactobacillus musae]|uniref:YbgA family protein n=1 Tax=Companilactobacillus musae TaxID=1903258 RepID=UPI000E657360|nr:YbgA family protein [Companilactobacillus musae]